MFPRTFGSLPWEDVEAPASGEEIIFPGANSETEMWVVVVVVIISHLVFVSGSR